jgi:hypothetical protein
MIVIIADRAGRVGGADAGDRSGDQRPARVSRRGGALPRTPPYEFAGLAKRGCVSSMRRALKQACRSLPRC